MALSLEEIVKKFEKPRRQSDGSYKCLCPSHYDKEPSLSISKGDIPGKIIFKCFAGCEMRDIIEKVGLTMADIEEDNNLPKWMIGLEAMYDYRDEGGEYLYSKLRYQEKKISYAQIINGERISGKGGASKTLYKLPELIEAVKNKEIIYITEGEKDVDTLRRIGLQATTAGGVNDWSKAFSKYFAGAWVVLLPDNDDKGHDLMTRIEKDIKGTCYCFKTVLTSDVDKGDVTDYLQEGHSKEELLELIERVPWTINKKLAEPPKLVKLSEVEDSEISWLWEPYIQANNISILRGDGGVGKTYLAAAIASAVTNEFTQVDMPGYLHRTGNVIYFGSEDDPGTLKRRVKACGGDPTKISLFTESFEMSDTETLTKFVRQEKAKLVIFDPLQAFLGSAVDMNRANEIRPVLDGLRTVARNEDCAILIIEHQNKMTSQRGLYRGIGSMDIVAAARSVLMAGFHPEEEDTRVCIQIKTNARRGLPVAFTILNNGEFEWKGTAAVTEEAVLNASGSHATGTNKNNPVIEGALAILKEHPAGWKGTSTEFMLEGSRLLPSVETLFEPIGIGKFLSSGAGILALKRKGVTVNIKNPKNKKVYELTLIQKKEDS